MRSAQLYLRQLLAGRDFAKGDALAEQMANYVYLVGDKDSGKAVVIDAAYAPSEIVEIARCDKMALVGAIVTHYHADHAGGILGGRMRISGVTDLLETIDLPVHIQAAELSWLVERTDIDPRSLVTHQSGETIMAGDIGLTVIHTPGHTEGSQCLFVDGQLLTGDTLFLDGCGRSDLPGGNAGELYESLTKRLAMVPDEVPVYPGHAYSAMPSASMGEIRRDNPVLAPLDRAAWLARFGQ